MNHGQFSADPETTWLTEEGTFDRRMKLIKDFWFEDPSLKRWKATVGAAVDGATIPRALWSIIGSPYTGDYRRASIVHDIACDEAGEDADLRLAADRMFFHACRAGGCSIWQSMILYLGVRIGALAPYVDSWHAAIAIEPTGPRTRRTDEEMQLERDFQSAAERLLAFGETDDPLVLEQRTNAVLTYVTGLSIAAFHGR